MILLIVDIVQISLIQWPKTKKKDLTNVGVLITDLVKENHYY